MKGKYFDKKRQMDILHFKNLRDKIQFNFLPAGTSIETRLKWIKLQKVS